MRTMFFNSEFSSRKRVSLGGRSERQMDREEFLKDCRSKYKAQSLLREETKKSNILRGLVSSFRQIFVPRQEQGIWSSVVPQELALLWEHLQKIQPLHDPIKTSHPKLRMLAYRTKLVPALWEFIKGCHENWIWSTLSKCDYLGGESPGWLLPLAVFCPVFRHILMNVSFEEFYEQQKPLSLKDIRIFIVILRQALWELLCEMPMTASNPSESASKISADGVRQNLIKDRIIAEASEILSQLQDFNGIREFAYPSDFHVDGVDEPFISQAAIENTRAHYILRQAPFLVPFPSRLKIYSSLLASYRQLHGSESVKHINIRRDHIIKDAHSLMSKLSEEDLRGQIQVSFVNDLGVEEAGIDGGGLFKEFIENITQTAFDVRKGYFKETDDHLLYPDPGSGLINEEHLQFFQFFGTLLGKAMYEGILVDIPFAPFFLRKLKQKCNYVHDLSLLDQELHRQLLGLKKNRLQTIGNPIEDPIKAMELYFSECANYGKRAEEELLHGGKNKRVTKHNVYTYIRLVAKHRLTIQIAQQSTHFLEGFLQIIPKEFIDMFNEHELQFLISGSQDLDVDDLRSNTNYESGYNREHRVIKMFWEVVEGFSPENKKELLKFVTGCSRGPLLGFRYLKRSFCIQSASEEALDRLPSSSTCINLLKLPPYRSKEQMKEKLQRAIKDGKDGFYSS